MCDAGAIKLQDVDSVRTLSIELLRVVHGLAAVARAKRIPYETIRITREKASAAVAERHIHAASMQAGGCGGGPLLVNGNRRHISSRLSAAARVRRHNVRIARRAVIAMHPIAAAARVLKPSDAPRRIKP